VCPIGPGHEARSLFRFRPRLFDGGLYRVDYGLAAADHARVAGAQGMKPPRKREDVAAAALSVPERMLLFCIASDTDWQKAAITGATITAMVVNGLIDRDAAGRLTLTEHGRAALSSLLKAPQGQT
jgi:hypothetical protein